MLQVIHIVCKEESRNAKENQDAREDVRKLDEEFVVLGQKEGEYVVHYSEQVETQVGYHEDEAAEVVLFELKEELPMCYDDTEVYYKDEALPYRCLIDGFLVVLYDVLGQVVCIINFCLLWSVLAFSILLLFGNIADLVWTLVSQSLQVQIGQLWSRDYFELLTGQVSRGMDV